MNSIIGSRDLSFEYQSSLEFAIEDRMIFKSIIFNDPVIMTTMFLEEVKSLLADILLEVDYEGSTSSIHLTLKEPADIYFIMKECLIYILANANPTSNIIESISRTLIRKKIEMNPNIGIIDASNWLTNICTSNTMYSFFKVLDMGSNKYTIII